MTVREEALGYVDIAAENRIKERVKFCIEEDYDIITIKKEIEYYESVMKYIRENLK